MSSCSSELASQQLLTTGLPFGQSHLVDLSAASVIELMALLLVRALQDLPGKPKIPPAQSGSSAAHSTALTVPCTRCACAPVFQSIRSSQGTVTSAMTTVISHKETSNMSARHESRKQLLFFKIFDFRFVAEYVS